MSLPNDAERVKFLAHVELQRTDWKLFRAMERRFAGAEWCDWRDAMREIASHPEGHAEPLPPEPPFGAPVSELDALREENARLRAEADRHNFPANLSDKLSDWDTGADENEARLSPEEAEAEVARLVSNQAEGFDLADEISGLSQTRRDDLTQALHKRKGRMRRERMTGATPQVEEAALDHLVDLLARRGV
jgi:hypothetical protein